MAVLTKKATYTRSLSWDLEDSISPHVPARILSLYGLGTQWGFPGDSVEKNPPEMQETQDMQVRSLGWKEPL